MNTVTDESPKRAVLAAADLGGYDADNSLDELAALCRTAGYEPVARVLQKRPSPDAATYLGKGILEDMAALLASGSADIAVFDDELTPSQLRNIEAACDCPVIDRTLLILNIFAMRAASAEGGLQVELARQRYMLPRLMGQGVKLSRQGSGTGTHRGPGETKLESDRRHIRRRITALEEELEALGMRRALRRKRRKKEGVPTVALVGYTNAGKSTLLNLLTGAGVLAEDKLFATLDPTARALLLPGGERALLIDTVGFISRLPTLLVEAFKATLEEVSAADLILHVCDASNPEFAHQMEVTDAILRDIGAGGVAKITALNKCDLLPALPDTLAEDCVALSARTGEGIPALLSAIARRLSSDYTLMDLLLPYTQTALLAVIREQGKVLAEDYAADGIRCRVRAHFSARGLLEPYAVR